MAQMTVLANAQVGLASTPGANTEASFLQLRYKVKPSGNTVLAIFDDLEEKKNWMARHQYYIFLKSYD